MGFLKLTAAANRLLAPLGRQIVKLAPAPTPEQGRVLLNLGSGNWSCRGWTNLDHPSAWYAGQQRGHAIVPYDIRRDRLPYADNSVDAVYCSHVVEHIEDGHIATMLGECHRVLKTGGVLRIACPDAEFLYEVSQRDTDFWRWREEWFLPRNYRLQTPPRTVDFLVREVATPKLAGYVNAVSQEDYLPAFRSMDREGFLQYITRGLAFRAEFPGDHINYWTYDKLAGMLRGAGFEFTVRSKRGASVCRWMQPAMEFDTTYPAMSLYADAVK